MFQFICSQILLYFALAVTIFVPGYFFLKAWLVNNKHISALETTILSVPLSIIIANFIIILIGKSPLPINAFNIFISIMTVSGINYYFYRKNNKTGGKNEPQKLKFSKNKIKLVILILFLTIFVKTAYLTDSVFPTSTDLGHHMYWSQLITSTGELPAYQERDLIDMDGQYVLSEPEKIDDFIIGEHLIFAAISMLSGISVISSFPSIVLHIINIFSILALVILALRLFINNKIITDFDRNFFIMTLLLTGPLYAISGAQSKFISGGVIGNTMGNLYIPIILYLFLRAFREKDKIFLFLALFIGSGMVYTHHLSTFIFIFISIFILIAFTLLNFKSLFQEIKTWFKIIFTKPVIIFAILFLLFFTLIYTPSYVATESIDTAVGTPVKSTRTGLTLAEIKFTGGEARSALAFIGVILLLVTFKKREKYGTAFLLAWTCGLFIMSWKPGLLFIDIPTNRVANYIAYPIAITAAFTLTYLLHNIKSSEDKFTSPYQLIKYSLLFLFAFILTSGFYDNSQSLGSKSNYQTALQTFHASNYLGKQFDKSTDVILKDHNYISADAWIKLFFRQDYNFPLSRAFFSRYDDPLKPREQCTLVMISKPNSEEARNCFASTGTNFIMISTEYDEKQFKKSDQFNKIYQNNEVGIMHRK